MKKIFVKYKILINGFNIIGDYEIDGFILREDNTYIHALRIEI